MAALAIILVAVLVAVSALAGVWVYAQRTRVQAAADLTALAAAQALGQSLTTEDAVNPCDAAVKLSQANRVNLSRCEVNPDLSVTVTVTTQVSIAGLSPLLSATARAGFVDAYGLQPLR